MSASTAVIPKWLYHTRLFSDMGRMTNMVAISMTNTAATIATQLDPSA